MYNVAFIHPKVLITNYHQLLKKWERLLPDGFVAVGGVAVEAVVGVVEIVGVVVFDIMVGVVGIAVVAAFEVGVWVVVVVEVPSAMK